MKQAITLFLLLIGLFPYRLCAQEVYGWNLNDSAHPEEVGPCQFDINNPSQFKILRKHDYGICAGAFVGNKYYVYTYQSTGNGSIPLNWATYDFKTGTLTVLADYSQMNTLFYDMTYDYLNGIMYALGINDGVSTLLKVNLNDGKTKEIAKLSQQYVSLACDRQGQLYAEDSYGCLSLITAEGTETMMNGGDVFPDIIFQSMTFNHQTGKLYWIAPTSRGGTQIVDIDPTTGYANDYYELMNERQIVGLDFPYSLAKPKAPSAITELTLQADFPGSHQLHGSFTTPTSTTDGSLLTSCDIYVLRNGTEIFKKSNTTPGSKINFTDLADHDALYTYTVYAENSIGKGEETQQQIFLGTDLPSAVRNIKITPSDDATETNISWEAPLHGIEGGFIGNEPLKYNIIRQPDGKVIANQTIQHSYTDRDVPLLNLYHYVITPFGKGKGQSAVSESLVLGTAHQLPYKCSFTDNDMYFWKTVNRNKDHTTWKRTMTNSGITCSYSDIAGDDWLIAYPVTLEKDKKYKIISEASAYNEEYPEKMSLYLGKGMQETDLDNFTLLQEFLIKNEEGGKRTYTTYYTTSETQTQNLAIRMHSDPDMFALTVHHIQIKEASEGSISGTIHDATSREGLKDTQISLKNAQQTYHTVSNTKGEWSLRQIPEGFYQLKISKTGYGVHSENVEISSDQQTTLQTLLRKLEKIMVSGNITDTKHQSISGAFVTLYPTEYDTIYSTESQTDGKLNLEIFEGSYKYHVKALGFHETKGQITLTRETAQLPSFVLQDKAVAPRKVNVYPSDGTIQIEWKEPVDAIRHTYCKGKGVARIGVLMYTPHSIVGTIFRRNMALTQVSWQTCGELGTHEKIDLVIFGLDNNGEPTSTILYEKKDIPNTDDTWSTYELDTPLILKEGALVAFRYNGNIAMAADGGSNEGLDFTPHVHVINTDYTQKEFEYLDQHNMEKNLLIAIHSTPLNAMQCMPSTALRHQEYRIYRKSLQSETEEWTPIGKTDKQTLKYKDSDFAHLAMGSYQYAVTSATSNEESDKTISRVISKDLEAKVVFHVTNNGGCTDTEPQIMLKRINAEPATFEATRLNSSEWIIQSLPKGDYFMIAKLDGFDDIRQEVSFRKESNDYHITIPFTERLLPAYNLKVERNAHNKSYVLTWNSDNYFFDDFESYHPFTLEPATPQNNWIYWDADKSNTVEFQNLTFKHMGEPMSYIIFNPEETEPQLTMLDKGAEAYSGKQYLASFGNPQKSNRDFIFSPILSFNGKAELSCKMKSFTHQIGNPSIMIGYTTTEYPMTENDIKWLTEPFSVSDKIWENISCKIPADAKRMVILNQTPQGYFLMLDDYFIGEEYPYLSPNNSKPLYDRASYEVKLDGEILTEQPYKKYSIELPSLEAGMHTVEVTAIYHSGQSQTKSLTFEVSAETNIIDITVENDKELIYYQSNGILYFADEVEQWSIYDMQGRPIKTGKDLQFQTSDIIPGIYLLKLTTTGHHSFTQKLLIP